MEEHRLSSRRRRRRQIGFRKLDLARYARVRFRLDHPTQDGCYAIYGFNVRARFFVEAHGKHGRCLDYDITYDDYDGLVGALAFLGKAGFFKIGDLRAALRRVARQGGEDLPPFQRRMLEVVWNLRRAGDPYDA